MEVSHGLHREDFWGFSGWRLWSLPGAGVPNSNCWSLLFVSTLFKLTGGFCEEHRPELNSDLCSESMMLETRGSVALPRISEIAPRGCDLSINANNGIG